MIDRLKEAVDGLNEEEAKSLLVQILLKVSWLEETDYPEQQLTKDLKHIYKDLLTFADAKNMPEKDYDAIHIVFGDAVAGSLKHALPASEKVIGLPEIFSTGPVWELHENIGIATRYEWFENHFLFDGEDMRNEKLRLKHAFLAVTSISESVPVFIWTGENAHEQTGMRLALYLLKDKANDVRIVHATSAAEALLNTAECTWYLRHSGEISPDTLKLIYASSQSSELLSAEQRIRFEEEWLSLASTRDVLRIWEDGEIVSVPDDFYDDYMIDTARKLHDENGQKDFMKSARVIGEVIGHLEQYLGDQYFEYRLRHLIMNGVFEIKGVPKAMRFYSVKLR